MIIDPDETPDSLACLGWALLLAVGAGMVIYFSR